MCYSQQQQYSICYHIVRELQIVCGVMDPAAPSGHQVKDPVQYSMEKLCHSITFENLDTQNSERSLFFLHPCTHTHTLSPINTTVNIPTAPFINTLQAIKQHDSLKTELMAPLSSFSPGGAHTHTHTHVQRTNANACIPFSVINAGHLSRSTFTGTGFQWSPL